MNNTIPISSKIPINGKKSGIKSSGIATYPTKKATDKIFFFIETSFEVKSQIEMERNDGHEIQLLIY